jgi:hypothetical protein
MSSGSAWRLEIESGRRLAQLIEGLEQHQAIALGRLRADLPDRVDVTTRRRLNGAEHPGIITRTQNYIVYRPGGPAFALLDLDTKGMPPEIDARIKELGGFWAALVSVLPQLAGVTRVERRSTSAGLYRIDTGEWLRGSGGFHVYVLVRDGTDIERFLACLHERCWLAGFGWLMVGAGGQLLERSIVDRVVGTPERLVFEGAPVLESPIGQDRDSRHCTVFDGEVLDTISACLPLTLVEQSRLKELRAKEAGRLGAEAAAARIRFIEERTRRFIDGGMTASDARRIVERQCAGVLLPDLALPFDDPDLAGTTVRAVLADPERFAGETLADPLEGAAYGTGKAKILLRADGTPWIHSFAHGGKIYELKLDFRTARAAIENMPPGEVADFFMHCVLTGDLFEDEIAQLKQIVINVSGITAAPLNARIKREQKEQAARQAEEKRRRRLAERRDPRPQLSVPAPDAPWIPEMEAIDSVLGSSPAAEPPVRDYEGFVSWCRLRRVLGLRAITSDGTNAAEIDNSRLPPPEMLLLTPLSEIEVAELVERHIDYVDAEGRSVHLPAPFVKHYVKRESGLPVVTSIVQLPIVLPNGEILTRRGLDRRCNAIFRVPPEIDAYVPARDHCDGRSTAEAIRFLMDEWLCDVLADYQGKCLLIACALTIIERAILPMRPAFFFTAGKRGGGKTTLIQMVAYGVLGHAAAASAWSPNDEERRKALLSYFLEGVPLIAWDNIERGTAISCPHIEKALTAELYSDRFLGTSERRIVQIDAVHLFTGNNIGPRGDLCSRALSVSLKVDRPDPENREFRHPDPIGWTKAHRGELLRALYTILLGNPRRGRQSPPTPPTRFKEWWDLVGSAVEFAAEQHTKLVEDEVKWHVADEPLERPKTISFKSLFIDGEAAGEEAVGLAALLVEMRRKWQGTFKARDVADYFAPESHPATDEARAMQSALERASGKLLRKIGATTITWSLKAVVNSPTQTDVGLLELKCTSDRRVGDVYQVVSR